MDAIHVMIEEMVNYKQRMHQAMELRHYGVLHSGSTFSNPSFNPFVTLIQD